MTLTRENVLVAARAVFQDTEMSEVVSVVAMYGTEPYECEIERVQIAIIELSGGSQEKLLQMVRLAKSDYRDVLAWQQLGPCSADEGAKLQATVKALINKWGDIKTK